MNITRLVVALVTIILASSGLLTAGGRASAVFPGEQPPSRLMPLALGSALDHPYAAPGLGTRQPGMPDTDQTGAARTPKSKLIPENISWMENALWGEGGFIRSIGIASPLTPEVRKHELSVRRTMLTMHQVGGFVTLASMITTLYYGQQYLNTGDRNYLDMHEIFIPITICLYGATGLLAVLSPPPLIRRDNETSTTTIHKTLAWVHFAGMILTPILGMAISHHGTDYYAQARYHQIAAYVTTAAFAAAMITVTF